MKDEKFSFSFELSFFFWSHRMNSLNVDTFLGKSDIISYQN